jgi:hypothetical protein
MPPPTALIVAPNPFSDLKFMDHLVRSLTAGMAAKAFSTAPRLERVVTIVQWVKGMQEMGYVTYCGEEDVEVVRH